MRRHGIWGLAALAAAATAALAAQAPQEPSPREPAALQEELGRVLRQLREQRQRYYTRKQAHEERLQALAEQVASLREERAELAKEKGELEARASTRRDQAAALEAEQQRYARLRTGVAAVLTRFVAEQRAAIQGGLPFRVDSRLELLERLARDLAGTELTVASLVELAWLFAEGELRHGAEGSAYTAEAALPDGRRKPARWCHLGHVFVGFVTEDGRECGYAAPSGDGFRWVLESEDAGASVVREAVRMLDRRDPPRLLLLPAVIRGEGEGSE